MRYFLEGFADGLAGLPVLALDLSHCFLHRLVVAELRLVRHHQQVLCGCDFLSEELPQVVRVLLHLLLEDVELAGQPQQVLMEDSVQGQGVLAELLG